MTLWCRMCQQPTEFDRKWVEDSDACTHCGTKGHWRTLDEPNVVYALNENDRRFLRSIKVTQD